MLNKLINKLTHYFLSRAYKQMQVADSKGIVYLHEDNVADFCDDYYTTFIEENK